jgi:hypothetical protein
MPDDPKLTPEEEAKFGKFFEKRIKEHAAANASAQAPAPSTPAPTHSSSGVPDIGAMIQKALDDRKKTEDGDSKLQQMQKDIEELKGAHTGRKRSWFSPLFD